ncbi:MAG: MerR family DNA-binding transcriptional regulator [Desulfobacterales bacterium]|nr:MerR family DNA-binding transcriptional regulator [Desulfobacteraceae bacterium]MDY0312595.1 MerR family DNA-binding transcriptional regulator [Desulfobacterales bacterium]
MSSDSPGSGPFTISDLAAEFDVSARTIRFYEEKGLLAPRRTRGNQRIYSRRDRARLRLILRGKRFGYRLDEIAEMIGFDEGDPDEAAQIRKSLAYGERKLEELRERMRELKLMEEDLQAVAAKLRRRLAQLEKGES